MSTGHGKEVTIKSYFFDFNLPVDELGPFQSLAVLLSISFSASRAALACDKASAKGPSTTRHRLLGTSCADSLALVVTTLQFKLAGAVFLPWPATSVNSLKIVSRSN